MKGISQTARPSTSFSIGKAPETAVEAVVAIVAHHEKPAGWHHHRPRIDLRMARITRRKIVRRRERRSRRLAGREERMRIGDPLAVAPDRAVDHLDPVSRKADHPLDQDQARARAETRTPGCRRDESPQDAPGTSRSKAPAPAGPRSYAESAGHTPPCSREYGRPPGSSAPSTPTESRTPRRTTNASRSPVSALSRSTRHTGARWTSANVVLGSSSAPRR